MGERANDAESEDRRAPRLRVVRGDPAPEDLAALTAVVTARARAQAEAVQAVGTHRERSTSRWADRSRQVRHPLPRGADAWRAAVR